MQNEPGDFSKSNNSLKNLYRSLIRRINNNRAMIYTLENIKTGVVYGFIIADSCYPCVVSIKIFMDESYKDTEHLKSALVYLFNKLFRHNVSQILIKTEKNNQKMQKILEATGFIYLGIYKDSMAYTLLKPGRKG
jgi:RimJ/RimL family protein N-acetyltransferase